MHEKCSHVRLLNVVHHTVLKANLGIFFSTYVFFSILLLIGYVLYTIEIDVWTTVNELKLLNYSCWVHINWIKYLDSVVM